MKYVKSFILSFKEPSYKDYILAAIVGMFISGIFNYQTYWFSSLFFLNKEKEGKGNDEP